MTSRFLVRFDWLALADQYNGGIKTGTIWTPVFCQGFISEPCTTEEIRSYMKDFAAERNNEYSKLTNVTIEAISDQTADSWLKSDACFWSGQINKIARRAAIRFQQENC